MGKEERKIKGKHFWYWSWWGQLAKIVCIFLHWKSRILSVTYSIIWAVTVSHPVTVPTAGWKPPPFQMFQCISIKILVTKSWDGRGCKHYQLMALGTQLCVRNRLLCMHCALRAAFVCTTGFTKSEKKIIEPGSPIFGGDHRILKIPQIKQTL